jgi:RNA polymerase sigma-70 factor (ECF subfamily)
MSSTPEELVTLAAGGDGAAIQSLLERHLPTIHAIVRRRMSRELRAKEESIDVVQSVCRQVLASQERFELRGEQEFGGWLLRTIELKLVDHYRFLTREKRDGAREEPPLDEGDPRWSAPGTGPLTSAVKHDEAERLRAAMEALPTLQREALRLHSADGLSFPEIAARLGLTLKQARWTVYQAKYRLTQRLDA